MEHFLGFAAKVFYDYRASSVNGQKKGTDLFSGNAGK